MRFIADLHIHSHFSRATSKELTIPGILGWAMRKGITLVGTGDFTHPGWLSELEGSLVEDGSGLLSPSRDTLALVSQGLPSTLDSDVRFILQVEVSSIYKKGGKVRKVHTLVFMPTLASARRFSQALGRLGNVTSDGRPILGLDPLHIFGIAKDVEADCFVIPAHVWTPHFSLFGSQSGFDSMEECFEDVAGEIFALETGLSSDIPMNRRWSALDRFTLVSSSDAHSPSKLGREATVLDCALTYDGVRDALRRGNRAGGPVVGTIEFFPEEGKYHLAGHRKCGVRAEPGDVRA